MKEGGSAVGYDVGERQAGFKSWKVVYCYTWVGLYSVGNGVIVKRSEQKRH